MNASPAVVGIGYVVVDRAYVDGLPAHAFLGGTCGNVLYALAAMGHDVAPVSELGEDPAAGILVDAMAKRGVRTAHLTRTRGLATPSIVERLDSSTRKHSFSFVDPDTGDKLQRWHPPTRADIDAAMPAILGARVLFVDRLSDLTAEAMRAAHSAGVVVVFEPQEIGNPLAFAETLRHVDVLKCSRERMEGIVGTRGVHENLVLVVTGGEQGLDVYRHFRRASLPSQRADLVIDTCGSGDMTTAGMIDGLLALGRRPKSVEDMLPGIVAGQKLAAAGCGHVGALGLVRFLDGEEIRHVMREGTTRRVAPEIEDATTFDDPSIPTGELLKAEAESIRRFLDKPGTRPSRYQLARAREVMVAAGLRVAAAPPVSETGAVLPLGAATKPTKVFFTDEELIVRLAGGTRLSVPLWWFPKLMEADESKRRNMYFSDDGIHWPDVDEDLGIAGLISGRKAPGAVRPTE